MNSLTTKSLKEHGAIIGILILFILSFAYNLNADADLWWDSSVYLGMGKYIYSSGQSGLYEASRPLAWPLILGFFWKIGLDAIFFGKLSVLLFWIGIVILTYSIAAKLFGKKTAIVSSFLLMFFPTFFLFNNILFTEIPSTFFIMLGMYFFINEKYNLGGLILGLAFMARFFQIFLIAPMYIFFIYLTYKKKAAKNQLVASLLFFLIPVLPFLILNIILYKNPFYPFLLQAWMAKFTGWAFNQPFRFYFIGLAKENILSIFSILGMILIFRSKKKMQALIPLIFLSGFIPHIFTPHKEMRFLIFILPLLSIMAGYGIVKFSGYFGKYRKIALFLILIIGILSIAPQLRLDKYDDKLDPFYKFMENQNIKDGLWISNPSFIAYGDSKADEIIYYPLYNADKIRDLNGKITKAKYVLINSCDLLPCPPYEGACAMEHEEFKDFLSKNFKPELSEKEGNCEYSIFTS